MPALRLRMISIVTDMLQTNVITDPPGSRALLLLLGQPRVHGVRSELFDGQRDFFWAEWLPRHIWARPWELLRPSGMRSGWGIARKTSKHRRVNRSAIEFPEDEVKSESGKRAIPAKNSEAWNKRLHATLLLLSTFEAMKVRRWREPLSRRATKLGVIFSGCAPRTQIAISIQRSRIALCGHSFSAAVQKIEQSI